MFIVLEDIMSRWNSVIFGPTFIYFLSMSLLSLVIDSWRYMALKEALQPNSSIPNKVPIWRSDMPMSGPYLSNLFLTMHQPKDLWNISIELTSMYAPPSVWKHLPLRSTLNISPVNYNLWPLVFGSLTLGKYFNHSFNQLTISLLREW